MQRGRRHIDVLSTLKRRCVSAGLLSHYAIITIANRQNHVSHYRVNHVLLLQKLSNPVFQVAIKIQSFCTF